VGDEWLFLFLVRSIGRNMLGELTSHTFGPSLERPAARVYLHGARPTGDRERCPKAGALGPITRWVHGSRPAPASDGTVQGRPPQIAAS
jgi:hypothetical protein